jgi:hypothetical protein
MARPSSRDPIEPMDLANMRENGVRSLDVQCGSRVCIAAAKVCSEVRSNTGPRDYV